MAFLEAMGQPLWPAGYVTTEQLQAWSAKAALMTHNLCRGTARAGLSLVAARVTGGARVAGCTLYVGCLA